MGIEVDSFAVVFDLDPDSIVIDSQTDVNLGCLGVAGDIGQSLLQDAEHGCGNRPIDVDLFGKVGDAADGGAPLELFNLPLDGRNQTEVIEQPRP